MNSLSAPIGAALLPLFPTLPRVPELIFQNIPVRENEGSRNRPHPDFTFKTKTKRAETAGAAGRRAIFRDPGVTGSTTDFLNYIRRTMGLTATLNGRCQLMVESHNGPSVSLLARSDHAAAAPLLAVPGSHVTPMPPRMVGDAASVLARSLD